MTTHDEHTSGTPSNDTERWIREAKEAFRRAAEAGHVAALFRALGTEPAHDRPWLRAPAEAGWPAPLLVAGPLGATMVSPA